MKDKKTAILALSRNVSARAGTGNGQSGSIELVASVRVAIEASGRITASLTENSHKTFRAFGDSGERLVAHRIVDFLQALFAHSLASVFAILFSPNVGRIVTFSATKADSRDE